MSDFVIITDACSDLTPALIEETGIHVMPMAFTMHGRELRQYSDYREISSHDFYEAIQQGDLPTTAAINVQEYLDAAAPYLAAGKDVLLFAFSSALSSTYQNAAIAAEELMAQNPGRRVIAIDSKSASLGQGMLAWHVAQLQKAGRSLDEVVAWLEEHIPMQCHWFTAEDLHHLKRGGRCSPATAWMGTLLAIKPVLHVNEKGELRPVRKARGRKAAHAALLEEMEKVVINPAEQTIFISHADCEEDAFHLRDAIAEKFGATEFRIGPISPVIGSHTGQGTIALFFFAKNRTV